VMRGEWRYDERERIYCSPLSKASSSSSSFVTAHLALATTSAYYDDDGVDDDDGVPLSKTTIALLP